MNKFFLGDKNITNIVNSDWNETNPNNESYIKNKPLLPSKLSELEDDLDHVKKTEIDTIISHSVANLIEIVMDSNQYDSILNTDGLINTLTEYTGVKVNVTKTDFKTRGNDIKFIRLTKPDKSSTTILNIVFVMPQLGIFCGYGFNKLNDNEIGIGYATCRYDTETTVKINSIRASMYYDNGKKTPMELQIEELENRITQLENKIANN